MKCAGNGLLVLCEGVCLTEGVASSSYCWPRSHPAKRPVQSTPRTAGARIADGSPRLQVTVCVWADPCVLRPAVWATARCPQQRPPPRRPSETTMSSPENVCGAWPVSVRLSVCSSFPLTGPHLGQTAQVRSEGDSPSPGEGAVGTAAACPRVGCGVSSHRRHSPL